MKLKYPKISAFIIAVILAYVIFSNPSIAGFISGLNSFGYIGAFIAGMFYTFGFTSPFSAGFFIDLNPQNIFLAGILGGLGALLGDLAIFEFVKKYFSDEFRKLGKEKVVVSIGKIFDLLDKKLRTYVLYLIAVILIASPLPDEAGITILAGLTKIKEYEIAIISIIFNTIGILILLNM